MEKSKLHIILSAAISIDGKIATHTGDSKLSSKQDVIRLHKLRSKVDAILVGKNTIVHDNPLLTVRFSKGKNPIRVILDSQGTISKTSKILQTSDNVPTIIAVSRNISQQNLKNLKKFPVEIIITGKTSVSIKALMSKLQKKGIKTILVEGGGTINWQFIKNCLFDEILITISPFIIGGTEAITFVQGKGFEKINQSPKLKLKSVKRLENHLFLHYIKT
ncbi:MAG: 2,5-diamino-6-(ribosylamino)-4(3H)-pyrimidinone 5'-phosphate reductase [Nitrosopumilus sp.]|nr:2,5-diamino-6-(ribosylamino)-4(3H)-pyrimidinone 5'-phosphate reductase [Nitrosopumilus sp.]